MQSVLIVVGSKYKSKISLTVYNIMNTNLIYKEVVMKKDIIETEIVVQENKIRVMRVGNTDYISLTDLARYANPSEPKIPIYAWMRNKDVLAYLGLWEKLNNKNFKGHEFETFMNEASKNSFYMSPQKWIKETNAVGIISKSGNNGGTYACSDIALEFASWLRPEFKLYVIQEFQHLKLFLDLLPNLLSHHATFH